MQPALEKLLERNLASDGQKRQRQRQRISKTQKRRRQKTAAQNEAIETASNKSAEKRKRALTKMRNVAALEAFDAEGGADELDNIKARILQLRSQRLKSSSAPQHNESDEDEDPLQWEGLTPGLAPVGYEESSDED